MIRRLLINAGIIWTDTYCAMRRYLLNAYIFIYSIYWHFWYKDQTNDRLIYAMSDKNNVTNIMRYYFKYDTALSPSSAQYWLRKFGIKCDILNIIQYKRNTLVFSRINLEDNIELLTDSDCYDMQDIPGKFII